MNPPTKNNIFNFIIMKCYLEPFSPLLIPPPLNFHLIYYSLSLLFCSSQFSLTIVFITSQLPQSPPTATHSFLYDVITFFSNENVLKKLGSLNFILKNLLLKPVCLIHNLHLKKYPIPIFLILCICLNFKNVTWILKIRKIYNNP